MADLSHLTPDSRKSVSSYAKFCNNPIILFVVRPARERKWYNFNLPHPGKVFKEWWKFPLAASKVDYRYALELPMKSKGRSVRSKQIFANLLYLFASIAAGYGLSFLLKPGRGSFSATTVPQPGEQIASTSSLGISFNQAVNRESAEAAFRITPALPGQFRWEGNTLVFTPSNPFAENQHYQLSLSADVMPTNGMRSASPLELQFSVRPAGILFLHPAEKNSQLWILPSPYSAVDAFQLTSTTVNVVDYTTARDGSFLVYTAQDATGIYSLWYLSIQTGEEKLLQNCDTGRCVFPTLSPQGNQAAFFRISSSESVEDNNNGLWILNIESATSTKIVSGDTAQWDTPAWSPDGSKIAFADAGVPGIRIVDLNTGREEVLYSSMGTSGSWSPDGKRYLFTELAMAGSQPQGIIYQADMEENSIETLFPIEDSSNSYRGPVYSPDGNWLLSGVHNRSTGPGYQLVLSSYPEMAARQITSEPDSTFGAAAWHPSSQAFLFQKIQNLNPDAMPSIWLFLLENNNAMLISENAYMPAFIP